MTTDAALDRAAALLAPWASVVSRPEPHRVDVAVAAADLVPAVRALREAEWGYLAAITGLDLGGAEDALEALYHFCAGAAIVTLRVRTPRSDASVPSICDLVPSASFFERELSEMLGVTVSGTPDPRRLYLPDDWPDGAYPLRKASAAGAAVADRDEEGRHAEP
jgi:Ni,Fe-hydrogenase III component G